MKTMKTATMWKTEVVAGVTVSTVLVQDGAARFYETSIITATGVEDGKRFAKKIDAQFEHDATCDAVLACTTRPDAFDKWSRRHERVAALLAAAVAS